MSNPAYIVEGFTEKLFLAEICPNQPIKRLEINGRNVSIEAITSRIESLAILLKGRYSPIVVLFDREEREASANGIAALVMSELKKRRPSDVFVVGVADRMIENWILADWDRMRKLNSGLPLVAPDTEGANGKALLRKFLAGKYSTTVEGPALLKSAHASAIKNASVSFSEFVSQIDVSCWWLNR